MNTENSSSSVPGCVAVENGRQVVHTLIVEQEPLSEPKSMTEVCLCDEKRIYFFADDHFNMHPGKVICDSLSPALREKIVFRENDPEFMEKAEWESECSLLILNRIAGTCSQPLPGHGMISAVQRYLKRGGNLLLLHGASAAFLPELWWRPVPGLRWVRGNDLAGAAASTHPKEPFSLKKNKCTHPLLEQLQECDLPADEIYTELEQTSPITVLMTTAISTGTWPQVFESTTRFGGKVLTFLPGHRPEVTSHPAVIANIEAMIRYLMPC